MFLASHENRVAVSKPRRSQKCVLGARNFSYLGGVQTRNEGSQRGPTTTHPTCNMRVTESDGTVLVLEMATVEEGRPVGTADDGIGYPHGGRLRRRRTRGRARLGRARGGRLSYNVRGRDNGASTLAQEKNEILETIAAMRTEAAIQAGKSPSSSGRRKRLKDPGARLRTSRRSRGQIDREVKRLEVESVAAAKVQAGLKTRQEEPCAEVEEAGRLRMDIIQENSEVDMNKSDVFRRKTWST